jgi:hypothetical protein
MVVSAMNIIRTLFVNYILVSAFVVTPHVMINEDEMK